MDITFLGTSSMVPTKERSHNAILAIHKGEGLLIDCGEGTQRQLRLAGIKATKITSILISHWHGDHVLGLPGLLQTMGASEYAGTLRIFGPPGSIEHFENMMRASIFQEKIHIEVREITEGVLLETDDLLVTAAPLEHSAPCLGFRIAEKDRLRINTRELSKRGIPPGPHLRTLQEGRDLAWKGTTHTAPELTTLAKGIIVSVIMDTRLCENAITLCKDADLVISEATFTADLQDKAAAFKHLTATDAGRIASDAGAKRLIITHFSQRYADVSPLLAEAQETFANTEAAHDLLQITL